MKDAAFRRKIGILSNECFFVFAQNVFLIKISVTFIFRYLQALY